MAQGHLVKLGAIRKFPDTGIVIRPLRLILQKSDQFFVSWLDRIGQRALCFIDQFRSRCVIEFLQFADFLFKISQQRTVRSGLVEWRPTNDLVTGLEHQRKNKLRRDNAFAFARPQIHDHLIE
jgi:hypothetical protein